MGIKQQGYDFQPEAKCVQIENAGAVQQEKWCKKYGVNILYVKINMEQKAQISTVSCGLKYGFWALWVDEF